MFAQPLAERTDLTEDHAWLPEARADIARGSAARLTYRDQEIVNVIPLKEPLTRIGRSATAHLRLEDPTVSRRHAIIKVDGDKLCLIDDRSLNGVYVNGVEIGDEAMLVDGDEIVIGRFHIFVLVP